MTGGSTVCMRSDRNAAMQVLRTSFSTTQRQKQAEKCSILSLRTADGRVGSRLLFHLHVRLLHYLGLRFVLYLNVAVAECKRRLRVPGGILFAIHYT